MALWQQNDSPVALKTAKSGVIHKTDAGGVLLGPDSENGVRKGYTKLAAKFGPRMVVAAMAPAGVEMFLGMIRDRDLGPVVLLGIGGIHAEILHDVVYGMPPFDASTAHRLIDTLGLRSLLDGVRGAPPSDVDSFAEAAAHL